MTPRSLSLLPHNIHLTVVAAGAVCMGGGSRMSPISQGGVSRVGAASLSHTISGVEATTSVFWSFPCFSDSGSNNKSRDLNSSLSSFIT